MKHTMSSPCEQCPFRNDLPRGYLTAGRVTEIGQSALRGQSFPCHKTTVPVEDDDGASDMQATENSVQCAGAEIFLAKQGTSTQMSRIAERLGMLVATLDMSAPVCANHGEMLAVHGHDLADEWEPCSVCDQNCLAPAGYAVGGSVIFNTDERGETSCCWGCGEHVCDNCSEVISGNVVCNHCKEDYVPPPQKRTKRAARKAKKRKTAKR